MKKWWIPVLAGVVVATILSRREKQRIVNRRWPVNFAHRGASWHVPENTLEAFELGVETGAGGLEMDAHPTRDGEVVVIHDDTVDRTTDGSGLVREKTLEELSRLDAGYRFSPDGASFPFRGKGVRISTLREVYEEFPEAVVNVEIKEDLPGIEGRVLRVIEECGAEKRTLVASFSHAVMRRFRKVSGGRIPTAASRFEISVFYFLSRACLEKLVPVEYEALQVPVKHRGLEIVTPRFIRAAHSRGVRVDAWTINDEKEMRRLLDLGADVIMTDRPEALSRVLAEREPET
ncbi:MAG: glycerophosphodiester phosphodiesterase [Rubrobacteraceae bacterium]